MRRQGDHPAAEPWDRGLQPERTALSWVRTGLGMVAVSLLLVRQAARVSAWLMLLALACGAAAATLAWAQHGIQGRRVRALHAGTSVLATTRVLTATTIVVVLALLALAITLGPMAG